MSDLSRLDLNLVSPLAMLLEERSVTRAAQRLDLSQPTLSGALARLRRHFDDPLLVRTRNGYRLTPLALELERRIPAALSGLERLFMDGPSTDPAVSEREYVILVADYALAVIGRPLLSVIGAQAPRVRTRFAPLSARPAHEIGSRLRSVDAAILPHGVLHGWNSMDLFEDRWVCIVADSNDRVGESVDLATMAASPWVVPFHGMTSATTASRQLRLLGIEPWVHVVTESFVSVPDLVAGSDRLALLQERLAVRVVPGSGTRIVACPIEAPLTEALWWHPAHEDDPQHKWLLNCFSDAARGLDHLPAPAGAALNARATRLTPPKAPTAPAG